jgi:hypothetical protein
LNVNWEDIKALNDEESQRIYRKKAEVAVVLQDAIESLMDIFLLEKSWNNAARPLADIETMWRVLGLEYVVASERRRLEREATA